MTPALYAHMNKKKKKKENHTTESQSLCPFLQKHFNNHPFYTFL
jgi:hypothetical protein